MKSQIIKAIEACESEMLDFTQQLVSLASENPPGRHYKECVDLIKDKIEQIGLEYQIIEVPGPDPAQAGEVPFPRYSIVSYFGTGKRTLFFHGHFDVVPAFERDQFKPRISNGRLYGRGASDMKSGLTSMLYAVKAIQMFNAKINGKICLTFVPDEETGGILGSNYLSQIGLLGKDGVGMLLPEPTSGVVWSANRGAISLEITVKGKAAHVGNQYQGVNAFEKMLIVVRELQKIKQEVELRITQYNLQPREARNSILMIGGLCRGGSGFNVVPEKVSFTVDRRINPEEDLEVEKSRLMDCFESIKAKGIDLEVTLLQEGASSSTSEKLPLSRVLSKNILQVMGQKAVFEMCPGLLEIRFYNRLGVPALAFGPGLLECSHGPEEFVEIKNIGRCAAVYALTALDLLSTND
jgi:acetylornithine deacetylase/succinyl-diaminopimelate desuccinylase family protein